MKALLRKTREKVEKYHRENECAKSVVWGEDSYTTINVEYKAINEFMNDVEEDGEIYYIPISDPTVTLNVA